MKIGIDLTGIWRPATGIFVYAKELARELLCLDEENDYTLFFSGEIHPDFHQAKNKFRSIVLPTCGEVVCKQLCVAGLCNSLPLDLIHFPALPPPVVCLRPFVWTLHDATPWLYPETMDRKGRLYFRWIGGLAARFCSAIITVSNDSKERILASLPISEKKVRVIYEGIDSAFSRLDDHDALSSVRSRYGLPTNFILSVGTLEPRKNLLFLVETFLRFRKATGTNIGLVIVGRSGWNAPVLEKFISDGNGSIILTGFVPHKDLVVLYNLAKVLVIPSIYEGFGFPPLEAMACGCPVIVSNRGSLPEVVGDAAVLIDPERQESLFGAIKSVLETPSLRAALLEKGLERVKKFSWKTAAVKTRELYSQVLAEA